MKKVISLLFSLILLTVVTLQSVEACSGTYYVSSIEEAGTISDAAAQNCCAGSSINIEDFYGNVIVYTVQFSGPNSSCAPE